MEFLLTLIVFVLVISILILVHELGHFWAAKKAGLIVEEFGLGFPPSLFSKKIGETKYSLNLIPLGGYVKIYGEDADEQENERSFYLQKWPVKAKVLFAGVLANIFLAVILFYFVLGFSGFKADLSLPFEYDFIFGKTEKTPFVAFVLEDSPAQKAGIEAGDLILLVDGEKKQTGKDFIEYAETKEDMTLVLKNMATEEQRNILIAGEEGKIGVGILDYTELAYYSSLEKAGSGFLHAVNMTHLSFFALTHIIKASFQERTIEPLKGSAAGLVGIFAVTGIVMTQGIIQLLNLIALISIGLAIVNILPIPALDGGRLVFVAYEALLKKQAPAEFEKKLNFMGFMFIILLIILVTYNDIVRFGGLIKEMF